MPAISNNYKQQNEYDRVSYTKFSDQYSSDGWVKRKIIAIPAMIYSGLIKSIYHLSNAVIQSIFRDDRSTSLHISSFKLFQQEGYGWLTILLNDKQGAYQLHKICHNALPALESSSAPQPQKADFNFPVSASQSSSVFPNLWQSSVNIKPVVSSISQSKKQQTLAEMRRNGYGLSNLSYDMRNDEDVVIMAINNSMLRVVKDATLSMKDNKKVALAAVKKDGLSLEHLSYRMKDNDEVVAEAVKSNSSAYKYASYRLKKKYEPKPSSIPRPSYNFGNNYSNFQNAYRPTFSSRFNTGFFNTSNSSENKTPNFKSPFTYPFENFFFGSQPGRQKSSGTSSTPPAAPPKVEWACPPELKNDNSEEGIIAKRIFKLEHDNSNLLSAKSPYKTEVRAIFCKMLGVDVTSTNDVMNLAYRKTSLKIHPDKCANKFAVEAFKPLSTVKNLL
ncbi:MAG: DUF4116 domain-containing protein [Parachlamydiaceae bacterium]|nr:DUF4116 domain-containing protein [Parachlamydiaceae bacterium]